MLKALKEEFIESKLKDSKLNEYLEEEKIMEQKIYEKEQKLQDNNNNKINKLKNLKNVLIRGLKKQERINELKTKENNELKNEIKKLTKSNIELGELPELFQDRTFALPDKDNEDIKKLLESKENPKDFDINELFRNEKKMNTYI